MNLFSISNSLADKTKINFKKKKPVIASKVPNSAVSYGVLGPTQSRTSFQVSEYNLGEISKVMDIESYVRQAFNKHVELCLKEGYDISSRNEQATLYIKRRFREMAEVSGYTLDMLLRYITQNIVSYSNAFLVKVRDFKRSTGAPIQRVNGPSLPPVAAYFPMDPTSIQIKRDYHGKVLKYWQRVPGNPIMPQFLPENIVHFYYDRKEGFAFGTPYIVPVLDDIRSLRRMEENVEMLVTQHLFPLYQYIVGTENSPAEIYEDGTSEVDVIKNQIERMPTEGSIVTPERHEIKNLGAEGKALDAENYLKYFEKRVMAGLGLSDIALGRGDSANRATATTIDKIMTDRCKDFQVVIEEVINEFIIKELLYEGGYVIDEKEDNFVKMRFREIDIDSLLKVQNHAVFKYEHHAITETEMREEISKDPISGGQREEMYFEMVQKPNAIIAARDEPYTAAAKTALKSGSSKSAGAKPAPGSAAKAKAKVTAPVNLKKKATENREKPTNQYGQKPAKTVQKKDSSNLLVILDSVWYKIKSEIINLSTNLQDWKSLPRDKVEEVVDNTVEDIYRSVSKDSVDIPTLRDGINGILEELIPTIFEIINSTEEKGDLVYNISGVFESLRFRLEELSDKAVIE